MNVERTLFIHKVNQAVNKFILLSLIFSLLNYNNQGWYFHWLYNSCLSQNIFWPLNLQSIIHYWGFRSFSITVASDYSVYNSLKLMTHTQCLFFLLLMMQILLVMHLIVLVYADIEGIIRECSKRSQSWDPAIGKSVNLCWWWNVFRFANTLKNTLKDALKDDIS